MSCDARQVTRQRFQERTVGTQWRRESHRNARRPGAGTVAGAGTGAGAGGEVKVGGWGGLRGPG